MNKLTDKDEEDFANSAVWFDGWSAGWSECVPSVVESIANWLCKPNEDGTPCSAERKMIAERIRRGDWKNR
jgi:hypothetical protein